VGKDQSRLLVDEGDRVHTVEVSAEVRFGRHLDVMNRNAHHLYHNIRLGDVVCDTESWG
jgi:hypothetical protein